MTRRPPRSQTHFAGSPYGRWFIMFAALGLLTMPLSYQGGASFAHPHAIFQFWSADSRVTADHHHGDDSEVGHEGDTMSGTPTIRSSAPDVPTISQVAHGSERADAMGGVLGPWFVLVLAAATFVVERGPTRTGRPLLPEIPPPRLLLSPV